MGVGIVASSSTKEVVALTRQELDTSVSCEDSGVGERSANLASYGHSCKYPILMYHDLRFSRLEL